MRFLGQSGREATETLGFPEDRRKRQAAIRQRDAGIRVTASGFVRGVIAGLIAEGEARRGPYGYIG